MAESTGGLNINEETFEEALVEIKRLGAIATIHAEDEKMRLELEELLKGDISPTIIQECAQRMRSSCCSKSPRSLFPRLKVRAHFCHISTLEAIGHDKKGKISCKKGKQRTSFYL